ncbi:MAG TPA: response regulator [Puia sp.]|nr:response regulator [Puia sp.]
MKKILVLDDDTDILILMQMTLKIHEFDVEAISRWQDIDESISKFNPDLIMLDVSLNGADGRDICKRLKLSAETGHIPIILFSANAEMGNNIGEFHAQAFIAKPYELAHLISTIKSHLN